MTLLFVQAMGPNTTSFTFYHVVEKFIDVRLFFLFFFSESTCFVRGVAK